MSDSVGLEKKKKKLELIEVYILLHGPFARGRPCSEQQIQPER